MSQKYTQEPKKSKPRLQEQRAYNSEQFIQRVKRNGDLTELTTYALRELVKAVYVKSAR